MQRRSLEERFWAKVDKRGPDECWPWLGYIMPNGYGQTSLGGKHIYAHRTSWMLSGRDIPFGMCVLHKCDFRRCVNPAHLWIGSVADNDRDRDEKGHTAKGEQGGMAKLTTAEVLQIRALSKDGVPGIVLSNQFNVSRATICRTIHRRCWSHVP